MVSVEQRDRLKRYLISKGIKAEETDKMIYFEQYRNLEQRMNRRRTIIKSLLAGLIIVYSAINYDEGYLPVKSMLEEGKNHSQIEEIIGENQSIILNRAVMPGRYLSYLLNDYKLEMRR